MRTVMNRIANFHADESGESTAISNVAVLAVGAIVLLAVLAFWNDTVKDKIIALVNDVLNNTTDSQTSTQ